MNGLQIEQAHVHPAIIGQTVEACRCEPGMVNAVTDLFGQFTADHIVTLLERARIQIQDISLKPEKYEHSAIELEGPILPNGYPVVGIYFDDVLVAFTAVLFRGTKIDMTHAEMVGAKTMLEEVM